MAEDPEAPVTEPSIPVSPVPSRRRRLGVVIQVVVLGVLLALVFRFFDREQIALAFASVSLPSFLTFVVLMLSLRLVAAWRWLVVARDHVGLSGLSFGFMVRVELLADFAGIWMQSMIGGEALRVWKIAQRTGEKTLGPGSVVLDRFVGLASLVIASLPFLVLLALRVPAPELPEGLSVKLWLLAATGAVGAVAVFFAWRYLETLRSPSLVPLRGNLARRALESATKSRFMIVPILISLSGYVLLYLGSIVGALAEISLHGTRFFRDVRMDKSI